MPEIRYLQGIETIFKIRAYGRMRLAEAYLSDLHPRLAYRKLQHWITICPDLSGCLLSLGYHGGERVYSPAMVWAIIESLGES